MARPIEAVLFDCDGVLVDSEILAAEVELACLAEIGMVYDPGEFQGRFMGMTNPEFFAALSADAQDRLGRPLDLDFFKAMKARYRAELRDRLQPVAGAREAVAATTLPKAVASSSDPDHLKLKLAIAGFGDTFGEHVYPAALVARGKPAPDLFLYTADRLGVDPAACLVIEDSINGIKAAKAADMLAIGLLAGRHCTQGHRERLLAAGADRVLDNFTPLLALISGQST